MQVYSYTEEGLYTVGVCFLLCVICKGLLSLKMFCNATSRATHVCEHRTSVHRHLHTNIGGIVCW